MSFIESYLETHQPQASSVCIVDTAALVENWRYLSDKVYPARCAAVVKADAYGLGLTLASQHFYEAGCTDFFVAQLEEALQLREILPKAHIMVLHGAAASMESVFVEKNLVPVVNSLVQLKRWQNEAFRQQKKLPVILHYDTAMNRLGFSEDEVDFLHKTPSALDGLTIEYHLSHYACADEVDHVLNKNQTEKFYRLIQGLPSAKLSLASSSAIFLNKAFHVDLVRPGAALYGINPTPYQKNPMKTVVHLYAKVIHIHGIKKGETVGYGASYKSGKTGQLAVVEFGYADGLLRALSNKGHVYFKGVRLNIVGRVSMDLITVDCSDAIGISVGQWVEILGKNQSADDLADQANTNGYEILTRIGSRCQRIYL